jgi:hypothetical protein
MAVSNADAVASLLAYGYMPNGTGGFHKLRDGQDSKRYQQWVPVSEEAFSGFYRYDLEKAGWEQTAHSGNADGTYNFVYSADEIKNIYDTAAAEGSF